MRLPGPLRTSFTARILLALMGTVGAVLLAVGAMVRSETARQVEAVSERASTEAAGRLAELAALRRRQFASVVQRLAGGSRTLAAVDEGDVDLLGQSVAYELDYANLTDVLVVFTDARARPILTLHDDDPMEGADPIGAGALAEALLQGDAGSEEVYRVVEGRLFGLQGQVIAFAGRPVGTVWIGMPWRDEDIRAIGELAGAELCFVVDGACVAGTEAALGRSRSVLEAADRSERGARIRTPDGTWSVRSRPLGQRQSPGPGQQQGLRQSQSGAELVVAVPLDRVVAPFARIRTAVWLAGAAALALALGLGAVLSRGLTRPVRALERATSRVARGDFDTHVAVESEDEIGRLGAAFNEMTRGLLLKERYRSVLDKVVSREVAEQLLEGGIELGGENRTATVLFADIRGFTALTEGMEPQEVIALLNACMQRLSDAVERHGGVVDKYVGDELMAVFGAPMAAPGDATRAVRAAVAMRHAMAELNDERASRGAERIGLGVGINTGVVVAGNMGSTNRLNYTVLGDTVNLAARLCSSASAGEILVSGRVVDAAGPVQEVAYESRGDRPFKGFRLPVEVYGLEDAPASRRPGASARVLLAAALALTGAPASLDAQVGYLSPGGTFQIDLSGQLDVEIFAPSGHEAGLLYGDGPWVAPRVRMFADVFVGNRIYALVEARADRGPGPTRGEEEFRFEQAFVRASAASGAVALQAGRFANPFGTYAARHLGPEDAFVRPPLAYDHRTTVGIAAVAGATPGFVGWRDDLVFAERGAPPVWGVPYPWGAMLSGVAGPVAYRVAAVNSSPSSEPEAWELGGGSLRHPNAVVGVGARLSPELSVDLSGSLGPYRAEGGGVDRLAYDQALVALAATWARGPAVVRGEVMRDRWEVPNVTPDAVEFGYSLEAQTDLAAGVWVAARFGLLDFRALEGNGGGLDWDRDTRRYEASVGYRLDRDSGIVVSGSTHRRAGPLDLDDDLLAARFWWAF